MSIMQSKYRTYYCRSSRWIDIATVIAHVSYYDIPHKSRQAADKELSDEHKYLTDS